MTDFARGAGVSRAGGPRGAGRRARAGGNARRVPSRRTRLPSRRAKGALIFVACAVAAWAGAGAGAAQEVARGAGRGAAPQQARVERAAEVDQFVERAAAAVCVERELDPRGSTPIDVLQARPSLPARHPEVLAGARRADLLLAAAKELTGEALLGLMREHRIAPAVRSAALRRVTLVRRVRPDVELRDNASVFFADPRTIRFGTLFLAGLRSDEGVLSVLAHELVHVADGPGGALSALFRSVGRRASAHAGRLLTASSATRRTAHTSRRARRCAPCSRSTPISRPRSRAKPGRKRSPRSTTPARRHSAVPPRRRRPRVSRSPVHLSVGWPDSPPRHRVHGGGTEKKIRDF
ncbi:MAG: hypothetical protein LC800_12355 [Acidobacteria bacterium]|nr:hypothetical protein [Acidobacteriota bacterium]